MPATSHAFLSPRTLARAVGVSESTVKRWVDEGRLEGLRTPGGHRRIPVASAARLVREAQLALVEPELLGLPGLGRLPVARGVATDPAERLERALAAGAADEAFALLAHLYMGGQPLGAVLDGPMATALAHLGELWHASPDGILVEHRATTVALSALARLAQLVPAPPPGAPTALGGAAPGDPAQLPSRMVALALRSAGIDAMDLGADVPLVALEHAVEVQRPGLAWVSVNHAARPADLAPRLTRLAQGLAARGARLLVGGRAAGVLDLRPTPGLELLTSLSEAVALAADRGGAEGVTAAGGGPATP